MFYLNLNSKLWSLVLGTEILMKTPTKVQNFASLSMIYDRNALLVLSVFTFSENKLVAWVVLVAGFVQQTFFPTTKINYFCFISNLLAPGSDPKFSKERTRSNLTRLGLNPIVIMSFWASRIIIQGDSWHCTEI